MVELTSNHRILPPNQSTPHDVTDILISLLDDVGTASLFSVSCLLASSPELGGVGRRSFNLKDSLRPTGDWQAYIPSLLPDIQG